MLCWPLLSAAPRPNQRSPSARSDHGKRPLLQRSDWPETTSPWKDQDGRNRRGLDAPCDRQRPAASDGIARDGRRAAEVGQGACAQALQVVEQGCAVVAPVALSRRPCEIHSPCRARSAFNRQLDQSAQRSGGPPDAPSIAATYIATAVMAKRRATSPILTIARSNQRMLKPAAHRTA